MATSNFYIPGSERPVLVKTHRADQGPALLEAENQTIETRLRIIPSMGIRVTMPYTIDIDNMIPIRYSAYQTKGNTITVTGASGPDSAILYTPRAYGNPLSRIGHVATGFSNAGLIDISGNDLTVYFKTGASGAVNETAVQVVNRVNANASGCAIAKATLPGLGTLEPGAGASGPTTYATMTAGALDAGVYAKGAVVTGYSSDILYISKRGLRDDLRIQHIATGASAARGFTMVAMATGYDIRVQAATDASVGVFSTETATGIAAAINNNPTMSLFIQAVAQGDGSGLIAPMGPTRFTQGIPNNLISATGYTQILTGFDTVAANQMSVNYETGVVTFNAAQSGAPFVDASYITAISQDPETYQAITQLNGTHVRTFGKRIRQGAGATGAPIDEFSQMFNKM